ncbi:15511_t:CDS:2 [Funneliformis caledonium]|uniref:15511_t:CDS:1 n=1 Tax=Funneliformis caledonium TaxID=1117310 RepID=A0A9N9AV35_9GLOM|nr:15511_t:CDS:2 [Funneliformis caledonium]
MVDPPMIISVQDHVVHGDGVKSLEIINTRYDMVAMSPNAKYIVGYGLDNDKNGCIVGWNIQDINEGKLELDDTVKPYDLKYRSVFYFSVSDKKINLSVSDEKIVAFTSYRYGNKIIDMNNQDRKIELDLMIELTILSYHFNTKNELILLGHKNDNGSFFIWVHSTQTEDNKWNFQNEYEIAEGMELISIKNDKIWLRNGNSIKESNYITCKNKYIRIFKDINEVKTEDIRISSNDKFTCLKINDEIIVYSDEIEKPFALLDTNYDDSVLKIKIDLELDINSLEELQIYEDAENWMAYFGIEKAKNNNNPFITNMEIDNGLYKYLWDYNKELVLQNQNIKVNIHKVINIIALRVYKRANEDDNWYLTVEYVQMIKGQESIDIIEAKMINNDIGILTSIGIFILNMSENDKISLKHFHYTLMKRTIFGDYPTFVDYKELIMGWISYINNDKLDFLKYGHVLLRFAIKVHDIKLISDIYKTCFYNFKQDLENNKTFLSIITTTMPLFKESYPDYLIRYSLDTNMIIDSMDYNVRQQTPLYLHPCTKKEKINTRSSIERIIFWIINCLLFSCVYIYNICASVYINIKIIPRDKELKPAITFIIPYFKFVSYPQKYSWWKELIKPQPSPFVETISRDIYKTMNGEALIIFKWNSYGKL